MSVKESLSIVENAWNLKKMMLQNKLIMVYSDDITDKSFEYLMNLAEDKLKQYNADIKSKKKILHILVEILQNTAKHGFKEGNNMVTSLFVIGLNGENNFFVLSGNTITNNCEKKLREKLDHLNSLDPDELRKFYRHTLTNKEFSEKGGAGLGMIDIMRKAQSKLHYHFTRIDEEHLFYTFKVDIKPKIAEETCE